MKVALITAPGGDSTHYGVTLSLGFLAAFLRREMPDAQIMLSQSVEDIQRFGPDVLGVSSTSCSIHEAIRIAQRVNAGCKVLGGSHVTALQELIPEQFDIGVIRDGEHVFHQICCRVAQDEPLDWIAGTNWRGFSGPKARWASTQLDLDDLPHPIRTKNPRKPSLSWISTSRGCPFDCPMCASTTYWHGVRYASAEWVVDDIEILLREQPEVRTIHVQDDLFAVNKQRLEQIVRLMEKRGLNKRVRFHVTVRSSLLDEKMMKLLKRLPAKEIRFGFETASNRLLEYLKPGTTVENHICTMYLARKYGVKCSASTMVGVPGETEEDLLKTFEFAHQNRQRIRISGWYLATPFPGSKFWDLAEEKGLVERSREFDFSRLIADWRNPRFNAKRAIYLNEENVPLPRLMSLMAAHGILHKPKAEKPHLRAETVIV